MISYNPLWKTLVDKGLKRMDLTKPPMSLASNTLAKLGKNENVNISVLERVCLGLGCRIEDVVEIKTDP